MLRDVLDVESFLKCYSNQVNGLEKEFSGWVSSQKIFSKTSNARDVFQVEKVIHENLLRSKESLPNPSSLKYFIQYCIYICSASSNHLVELFFNQCLKQDSLNTSAASYELFKEKYPFYLELCDNLCVGPDSLDHDGRVHLHDVLESLENIFRIQIKFFCLSKPTLQHLMQIDSQKIEETLANMIQTAIYLRVPIEFLGFICEIYQRVGLESECSEKAGLVVRQYPIEEMQIFIDQGFKVNESFLKKISEQEAPVAGGKLLVFLSAFVKNEMIFSDPKWILRLALNLGAQDELVEGIIEKVQRARQSLDKTVLLAALEQERPTSLLQLLLAQSGVFVDMQVIECAIQKQRSDYTIKILIDCFLSEHRNLDMLKRNGNQQLRHEVIELSKKYGVFEGFFKKLLEEDQFG